MPPPVLIDLDTVDLSKVEYDHEYIYSRMPHRHEFEMLDGVYMFDREAGIAVAYRKCAADQWWAKAHFPGRPVFPGVLQLEAGAQVVAFMTRYVDSCDYFIAFGGVENCRFREIVTPPATFILVAKLIENRSRRVVADVQGLVEGRLVFEARIIGMPMPAESG